MTVTRKNIRRVPRGGYRSRALFHISRNVSSRWEQQSFMVNQTWRNIRKRSYKCRYRVCFCYSSRDSFLRCVQKFRVQNNKFRFKSFSGFEWLTEKSYLSLKILTYASKNGWTRSFRAHSSWGWVVRSPDSFVGPGKSEEVNFAEFPVRQKVSIESALSDCETPRSWSPASMAWELKSARTSFCLE